MRRMPSRSLGEVLDEGQAGLMVVYAANIADEIAAYIKTATRIASNATDLAADALAREINDAGPATPTQAT